MKIKFIVDSSIAEDNDLVRGRFLVCMGEKIVEEVKVDTYDIVNFARFLKEWKNYEANEQEVELFKEMVIFNYNT